MYVCMSVCMYVYIHAYTYVCIHTHACIHTHVCMHVRVQLCGYVASTHAQNQNVYVAMMQVMGAPDAQMLDAADGKNDDDSDKVS